MLRAAIIRLACSSSSGRLGFSCDRVAQKNCDFALRVTWLNGRSRPLGFTIGPIVCANQFPPCTLLVFSLLSNSQTGADGRRALRPRPARHSTFARERDFSKGASFLTVWLRLRAR